MSTMTSSRPGPPPPVATEAEQRRIIEDPERERLYGEGLAAVADAHRLTLIAQEHETRVRHEELLPHTVPLTRAEEQRQRSHGGAAGTS